MLILASAASAANETVKVPGKPETKQKVGKMTRWTGTIQSDSNAMIHLIPGRGSSFLFSCRDENVALAFVHMKASLDVVDDILKYTNG